MEQWKDFWIVPAIMAAVIAVLFFVTFWDKVQVEDADLKDIAADTPEGMP